MSSFSKQPTREGQWGRLSVRDNGKQEREAPGSDFLSQVSGTLPVSPPGQGQDGTLPECPCVRPDFPWATAMAGLF